MELQIQEVEVEVDQIMLLVALLNLLVEKELLY
jgi:hypothetical protein